MELVVVMVLKIDEKRKNTTIKGKRNDARISSHLVEISGCFYTDKYINI